MLKQIIVGEEMIPVKYHGQVKFLVFECNQCHTHFKKGESYFKKQSKRREHACCFCSPSCRTQYQMNNLAPQMKKTEERTDKPHEQQSVQHEIPPQSVQVEQPQPVFHAQTPDASSEPNPVMETTPHTEELPKKEEEKESGLGGWFSKLFK